MSRLLEEIPERLETERLRLRLPLPGDGPALREAVIESLPSLRLWMPWARGEPTPEESEVSVRRAWLRFLARKEFRFHVLLPDGRFAGCVGAHPRNWKVPSFELGYWLRTSLEGRGYATEAVRAVVDWAFDALAAQRLEIKCDAENVRSAALAERIEFLPEARMRHDRRSLTDGSLRDTRLFSRVAPVDPSRP